MITTRALLAVSLALLLGSAAAGLPAAWGAKPPHQSTATPGSRAPSPGGTPSLDRLRLAGERARQRPHVALVSVLCPQYRVPVFNLGLAELAGFLRHQHRELRRDKGRIRFIEPEHTQGVELADGGDIKYTLDELRQTKPHIIGITAKVGSAGNLKRLLEALRGEEWAKASLIVVGNSLGTFSHQQLSAKFPEVVFAMGEGELTIDGLYQAVKHRRTELSQVPNIAYKEDGKLVVTRRDVLDLSRQFWLPAFDMLDAALQAGSLPTCEGSRGCPGHCTFCSVGQLDAKTTANRTKAPVGWRHFPVARTARVMQIVRQRGADYVGMVDSEAGSRDLKYLGKLAKALQRAPVPSFDMDLRLDAIAASARPGEVEATLRQLRRAGLSKVFGGAESGSAKTLKYFGKGYPVEVNLAGVSALLRAGVRPELGFIMFDPLMTRTDLMDNLRFLETKVEFSPEQPAVPVAHMVSCPINVMRVQKDTPYHALVKRAGLLGRLDGSGAFYGARYLDPRMGKLADLSRSWFRGAMKARYPVLQIANYSAASPRRQRARELVGRMHDLDLAYLRALVAVFPEEDPLATLSRPPRSDELQRARELGAELTGLVKAKTPELQAITTRFKRQRGALVREMADFLAATGTVP